jgi:hypothetical protein
LPNRLGLAAAFLLTAVLAGCTHPAPGTTAWEIHGSHAGIAGFASQVYARQGQQVTLYVSTTGPWFRAQAFRVGWYRGKGARDRGANIVFFAASPVLRHVRTQPSPFGADRELVDYRDSAADPPDGKANPRQVTGNEWSNPPSSWPEYDFVGDTYAGFLEPGLHVGFRVADASAWAFAGTGLRDARSSPAWSPPTSISSTRPTASPPTTRSWATRRSRPAWARPASAPSSPT